MRILRPCIGPTWTDRCDDGAMALPGRPRCVACERLEQARRNRRRPHYRGDWPRIAKAAVEAHVARHGWVCPGWKRDPHPVPPGTLTAEHVKPRSRKKGIAVMCQKCASRQGGERS